MNCTIVQFLSVLESYLSTAYLTCGMFQKKLSFFTKGFQNKFWTICLKVQQHLFWQVSWKDRYTKNSIYCLSILVESPNASELKLVLRMYTLQCTVYTDIYINISNLKSACPSICTFVCNLIKLIMDIVKYLDRALIQKNSKHCLFKGIEIPSMRVLI